ncbi:hypothetical protein [Nocardia sp. CA-135398]
MTTPIPISLGDARNRESCKNTLLTLDEHLIERANASATECQLESR